jgi:hypothetical protein
MKKIIQRVLLAASCFLAAIPAFGQGIGGNASLSVTTASSRVALPAAKATYPSAIVAPAAGSTQEVFYALGDSTVAATTSSPSLPSGGICIANLGPATNVAAITATGTATVRITQVSACFPFAAGGVSTGGGGGAVTIADGADVAEGTTTDGACAGDATSGCTSLNRLSRIAARLTTINTTLGSPLQAGGTVTANLGTLNGAATAANQTTANASLATIATNTGAAIPAGSAIIGITGSTGYETVAASQTGQALGATGATGDYLSHCVVYPSSTTPGVVTVYDNTSSAANNAIAFPGGASSVSNLVPFAIPVGAVSVNGAWKVTTGANVVVTCYGRFT